MFGIGVDDNMIYHYPEQDQVQLIGGWGWESLGGPTGGFTRGSLRGVAGIGQAVHRRHRDGRGIPITRPGTTAGQTASCWAAASPSARRPPSRSIRAEWTSWCAAPTTTCGSTSPPTTGRRVGKGRGYWSNLAWSGLGGGLTASPSVAVRDDSRVDVFAGDGYHPYVFSPWDTDGHTQIMHAWYDNGWSDWHSIGGIIPSDNITLFRRRRRRFEHDAGPAL